MLILKEVKITFSLTLIGFCEENICICLFNNFWRALAIFPKFLKVLFDTKLRRFSLNTEATEKKAIP